MYDLNVEYILKLHEKIAINQLLQPGCFRPLKSLVSIGGTTFQPKDYNYNEIESRINKVLEISDPLTRGLEYYALATFGWK